MAEANHGNGAGRPTLEQVAAAAGVSRGTVSRVVNGSPQVSESARAAVLQAVHELGYVPNRAARSLASRRADSVAFVVSEPETRVFGEPFFASLLRGASRELSNSGLQLVLVMSWTAREHAQVEQYVHNGHVDGLMLVSVHGDDPLPARLSSGGIPVVMAGRPHVTTPEIPYVDSDNVGGARSATNYLYDQGRRRIATITGPQDMSVGVDRLAGYRSALRGRRGVPRDLYAIGDFGRESGERAMRQLLEREPALDAVFAASDLMAAGALIALRAMGRRVPEDVAVIGFDDSEVAGHTDPPLSSVRQPVEFMGREMARMLRAMIEGGDRKVAPLILPTELVLRGST
ncbi:MULTISPECIES: LacI family DNA-binding transcriptional regulator [Actinoalloteichus]|uniref:Transcriptional regulator, LacI family n=1 Tax=Actinoalloteichus fjordicus TaxID=1612552 RepID=A0AAC9LE77_9PSEU|nr:MULTISPECIES: LacI family DNA-binding transcriptional regulator [Actinoalloteichus]APU16243.1 transcriptional regulator, LacI family [Actinoalloteichus fjordicus]APU22303.1 transcriptional regulator, LacI family [Actinoalloteichus sp. GBA129-24]